MEWAEVVDNPLLQDLPFKIELNRWGKILMSPASNNHGILQFDVGTIVKLTTYTEDAEDGVRSRTIAIPILCYTNR